MAIYRTNKVLEVTGLSRTTLWRKERAGEFPERVQLGAHSVGWLAEEVEAWIASRPRGTCNASGFGSSSVEAD